MPTSPFTSLDSLAAHVRDGDAVGLGGLHFCRIPVALLQAVTARQPKRLHYASWGGGVPLEMLLGAGCLAEITFCFSSLDVFGMAPLFRRACEKNEVKVNELNALAFIQGLHAAQQNLPHMPYQAPKGSDFFKALPAQEQASGIALAKPIPVDVMLLHATRADEAGNVEILGALGLDISMAWAAKKILVTVDEVVPAGTFDPRGLGALPRHIVSAIALAPRGAWPSASPGHYVADFSALAKAFESVPMALPAPDESRLPLLDKAAGLKVAQMSTAVLRKHSRFQVAADAPASIAEIMICRLAAEYPANGYCSGGAVSPLAIVSYLLAKATHPKLAIMTTSGGYVDIGARPMLMLSSDVMDSQTAATVCGGEDTYHHYYQRGLITHEVVGAAQIDQYARTNNQWLQKPDGSPLRLPGQGGMADVANMHANFTLYMPRHSKQALVKEVLRCSASRAVFTPKERAAAGYADGKVVLVTDLGMFEVDGDSRQLRLVSLHPGVSGEQIQEATGFSLDIPHDIPTTALPSAEQLRLIREEIDPLGFRRLEFIASRERKTLIAELVAAEEAALADMLA